MAFINEEERFCARCGTAFEKRELEGEGTVQFCPRCGEYHFPVFNTACSMIVVDPRGKKILLIKQYHRDHYVLVAGYVNRGEDAEQTVAREIKEETGLVAGKISFNRSKYFERSNTLMLNWTVEIEDSSALKPNSEVDSYHWFTFEEARRNVKDCSLAQWFLNSYLDSLE
ncbi:MAG: NUDIX domain-containing protein [Spirochaetales bacterium]|nr:NUDIX domain-containing protein [Spirochaetales bacterium]